MNIVSRRMARGDLKQIAALEREIFAAPWSEGMLLSELITPHSRYVVLDMDEVIVAYAGCWVIGDEAHINNVGVAPQVRRKGLGERIMRELARIAFNSGAQSMTLEVRVSNAAARSLYLKLGFVTRGIRPKYYTDNQEDAEIMWLDDIGPLVGTTR